MRFTVVFLFLCVAIVACSGRLVSQTPPLPPPPTSKAAPPSTVSSELTDAEFDAKLLETIQTPQQWKQKSFAGFGLKADLPREPVRQSETFYDEALGNGRMVMYVAAGDEAVFLVGGLALPYSITDEKLLRDTYNDVIKEFANDPDMKLTDPKDFYIEGKLGIEMTTAVGKRIVPAKARVFLTGKNVILMLAAPRELEEGETSTKDLTKAVHSDLSRFFSSVVVDKSIQPIIPVNEDPVFAGSFGSGVYRSNHFKFSLRLPDGWLRVSSEDVDGLRKWGRDFLAANSDDRIPVNTKTRQNLATFVSAPLGTEGIASISINRGIPATEAGTDMQMAQLTESLVATVATYQVLRKPTRVKLGEIPAVVLESKIKFSGAIQNQIIYYFQRNGFVVALTIGYFNEADRPKVIASIETLVFEK